MRGKLICGGIGVVMLAMSIGALAQTEGQEHPGNQSFPGREHIGEVHFRGLINDYSPASVSPLGPWEVRGAWSMTWRKYIGTTDFSAALTMERSDYWVLTNSADVDNPSLRTQHTHHLTLVGGTVTPIANGFRVTGPVVVTGSGNPAPFGPDSTLQIDVTGGSLVTYSNIKLTFGGDAAAHFGTQPLNGVVRSAK